MESKPKQSGHIVLALIVAAAMIGSAYFQIGPENTWLYLVGVWALLLAAFEVYSSWRERRRRP